MALREKVEDCTNTRDMNVGGEIVWMGMETWEIGDRSRCERLTKTRHMEKCQKETCYSEYYFKNEE